MKIVKAEFTDLAEILKLQYLAYQSEAALFGKNVIIKDFVLTDMKKQSILNTLLF